MHWKSAYQNNNGHFMQKPLSRQLYQCNSEPIMSKSFNAMYITIWPSASPSLCPTICVWWNILVTCFPLHVTKDGENVPGGAESSSLAFYCFAGSDPHQFARSYLSQSPNLLPLSGGICLIHRWNAPPSAPSVRVPPSLIFNHFIHKIQGEDG